MVDETHTVHRERSGCASCLSPEILPEESCVAAQGHLVAGPEVVRREFVNTSLTLHTEDPDCPVGRLRCERQSFAIVFVLRVCPPFTGIISTLSVVSVAGDGDNEKDDGKGTIDDNNNSTFCTEGVTVTRPEHPPIRARGNG